MADFYTSNIKILGESPNITFQDIWDIHRPYAVWGVVGRGPSVQPQMADERRQLCIGFIDTGREVVGRLFSHL